MDYLMVRHKVADFDQWKTFFDSHKEVQLEYGLHFHMLHRNIDDPDELFIIFEIADLDRAREFLNSTELFIVQKQAGVLDKPDIWFLK